MSSQDLRLSLKIMKSLCRFLVVLMITNVHGIKADCIVSMNGGLPDPEPLILVAEGSHDVFGFKLPSAGGNLLLAEGESVRLVCPGPGNMFWSSNPPQRDILVTCAGGSFQLSPAFPPQPLEFFKCSADSQSTTRVTPALCNQQRDRVIEIGFEVGPGEFYSVMEVCFDQRGLNSVWSKFDLVSSIRDGEVGLANRPRFDPGPYYPGLTVGNADVLYTRAKQRDTIARIIGAENANAFIPRIPADSRYYLSRGHLTASADFLYNALKLSTYYLINAAPQWYSFNDGSWRELESSVRFYAHSRHLDLVVFTGTHGVDSLPDSDEIEHELYLDPEPELNRLAVPAVYWKVLYHPPSQKGIAFVGVNNPHKSFQLVDNDQRYQLCENKLDVPFWGMCRAYQPQYQEQGFGYCCEIDDFRRTVTSLPPFTVTGVLE